MPALSPGILAHVPDGIGLDGAEYLDPDNTWGPVTPGVGSIELHLDNGHTVRVPGVVSNPDGGYLLATEVPMGEDGRGPGRPPVGPKYEVRLPDSTIERIRPLGKRGAVLRYLVEYGLDRVEADAAAEGVEPADIVARLRQRFG